MSPPSAILRGTTFLAIINKCMTRPAFHVPYWETEDPRGRLTCLKPGGHTDKGQKSGLLTPSQGLSPLSPLAGTTLLRTLASSFEEWKERTFLHLYEFLEDNEAEGRAMLDEHKAA